MCTAGDGNPVADSKLHFIDLTENPSTLIDKIEGGKEARTNDVEMYGMPEGVVFRNDGRYICARNFTDSDISTLAQCRALEAIFNTLPSTKCLSGATSRCVLSQPTYMGLSS